MMIKLIKAILSSYYWVKALQSASREEYLKAKKYIRLCERFSRKADPEIYLLYAFILFANGDDSDCVVYAENSIKSLFASKKLSCNDRNYMCAFAMDLINLADKETVYEDLSMCGEYDINCVSKHLLNNFPQN